MYIYIRNKESKRRILSRNRKRRIRLLIWAFPDGSGYPATILFVRTLTKRISATIPNAHADFATNSSATPKELYTPSAFIKKKESDNVNGDTFVRSMRDSIRA
ncbi:hypothetical protein EZS27_041453 [termite gut metagenome]|uniref:Uncharacterized protein n=1 Tax=termite gut metagenome TaxID=433724 RepID=A0A5J4PC27_9ZZZZ